MTAVDKAREAMQRGEKHMGDLCWPEIWGVGELTKRAELRAWLVAEGLPDAMAREDVTARKAFGLALADCLTMPDMKAFAVQREDKRAQAALIREHVGTGVAKVTRTWAKLSLDAAGNPALTWNVDASTWGSDDAARAVFDMFVTRFERHRDYVSHGEVGTMCTEAFLDYFGGVRLRRNGGVYYVPPESADKLRAFSRVMTKLGSSSVPFLPVYDSAETVNVIGEQLHSELERQVLYVMEEAESLGGENGKARNSSLEVRLDKLVDIRNRSIACGVLLDGYRAQLEEALERAHASISELQKLAA